MLASMSRPARCSRSGQTIRHVAVREREVQVDRPQQRAELAGSSPPATVDHPLPDLRRSLGGERADGDEEAGHPAPLREFGGLDRERRADRVQARPGGSQGSPRSPTAGLLDLRPQDLPVDALAIGLAGLEDARPCPDVARALRGTGWPGTPGREHPRSAGSGAPRRWRYT